MAFNNNRKRVPRGASNEPLEDLSDLELDDEDSDPPDELPSPDLNAGEEWHHGT